MRRSLRIAPREVHLIIFLLKNNICKTLSHIVTRRLNVTYRDSDVGLKIPQLLPQRLSQGSDRKLAGSIHVERGWTHPWNLMPEDAASDIFSFIYLSFPVACIWQQTYRGVQGDFPGKFIIRSSLYNWEKILYKTYIINYLLIWIMCPSSTPVSFISLYACWEQTVSPMTFTSNTSLKCSTFPSGTGREENMTKS